MWTVGDRLRKARESARISVQEMADRLGRERNSITRYERLPVAQTMVVRMYALETGVSADWIEHGDLPAPSGGVPLLQDRRSRNRNVTAQVERPVRCIHALLAA